MFVSKRLKNKCCRYLFSLLVLLILSPFAAADNVHFSTVIVVDQENTNGPWDGSWDHPYATIQDAIQHASPHSEIIVMQGIYKEQIVIHQPISIIGKNKPLIDGMHNPSIIQIMSDNVRIENFEIKNSGGYNTDVALKITQATNISIIDTIFHHTRTAITIENSSKIHIYNNTFSNNGNGLFIKHCENIIIDKNRFTHNAIAIVLQYSSTISTTFSSFIGNGLSGLISQCSDLNISSCNLSDNSVNKGGFFLTDTLNSHFSNCLFRHNGDGISLSSSDNINIEYCEFLQNTHFALSLRTASKNIIISKCIIADNLRSGIYIEEGNQCQISMCNINNNYLYDITGDSFTCLAENNWWGSAIGPFHSNNELLLFAFVIDSYPWAKVAWKDIGIQDQKLPSFDDISFAPDWTITLSEPDTDQDNVPDWWEEKWGYSPLIWNDHLHLDPDNDSLNNVQECYTDQYGSNPYVKDVFLELDWMKGDNGAENKPSEELLQRIIDNFSSHNITLHVDTGNLGGGSEIPEVCTKPSSYLDLHNLYWTYFLNNDMENPRKGIFHYGVISNYCADLNFPFMGWDVLDSFAISVEWIEDSYQFLKRENIIAGATVHHLGHTLGLIADVYQGIDNVGTTHFFTKQWFTFLPYISCMNYFYKYRIFSYSDGSHGNNDFNDWEHINFSFFQHSYFPKKE